MTEESHKFDPEEARYHLKQTKERLDELPAEWIGALDDLLRWHLPDVMNQLEMALKENAELKEKLKSTANNIEL